MAYLGFCPGGEYVGKHNFLDGGGGGGSLTIIIKLTNKKKDPGDLSHIPLPCKYAIVNDHIM